MDGEGLSSRLHAQASWARSAWFPGAGLLALSVALVAVGACLLLVNQNRLRDSVHRVEHTEQVLRQAADLEIALIDAETATRAFVLTDNPGYLTAYQDARRSIGGQMDALAKLVADNPAQTAHLDKLRPLVKTRLERFDASVATDPARRDVLFTPQQAEAGQALRRQVRAELDAFRANELALRDQRQTLVERDASLASGLAALTGVLAVAIAGFGLFLLLRERNRHRMRELQVELRHLSRLSTIGQTASMLAHEINQPLTATSNYVEALRRMLDSAAEPPAAKVGETLQKIKAQLQRTGQIVGRLRRFVEKRETERIAEDPAVLIEEAISLLGTLNVAVALKTSVAPGLPPVVIDRVQIQQVLVNLMRNAVEAMEAMPRRELTVSAMTSADGSVRVSVADCGPGLPPEVAQRLFQPFVSTKADGMGVGLSICRAIISEHGGRIWTETNPTCGTVFHFTLPVSGEARPA